VLRAPPAPAYSPTQEVFALERFRPHIEAALLYAGHTHRFEDVLELIAAGHVQCWPGPASVVITELCSFPLTKSLNIWLAGGNLAEIEQMEPHILAWGRSQGCATATFTGRRGWARTFLTHRAGWSESLVMFSKSLTTRVEGTHEQKGISERPKDDREPE
jgi:hypothetical protein